jgi:flagella basal body P-ring formation protein FlgA
MNRLLSSLVALLAVAVSASAATLPAPAALPLAAPMSSAQLVDALTRDLTAHFRLVGDFQLELVRAWVPPDKTATTWDVVVAEYPAIPTATMIVRCQILADGVVAADDTLMLRGALWRDAWFTHEPIAAGAVFDPVTLEARRVDCLRERDALPATAGSDDYVLVRQMPANRMLTWQDLARRPLVRKGEEVDVVASEGALLVTMKALAIENGVRGDIVTVRNLESRKDISALVVAQDRVVVQF